MSTEKTATDIGHVEAHAGADRSWRNEKWTGTQRLSVVAQEHAIEEKEETIMQAIKGNKKALFWCFAVSLVVIMEGYDTNLIGNFYKSHYDRRSSTAIQFFQTKFGDPVPVTPQTPAGFSLSAAWQTGLGQGSGVGSIFGTILNGWLVTAFGPRNVLLYTLGVMSCFLFIVFFAPTKEVLLVGQIMLGFEWGIFATTSPAYASECLPTKLRVYMTSWTNMCFIIGQFISAGVLRGFVHRVDQWGYRIPYALQWIWPCFLLPLVFFTPESPWHLVRKNRLEEAEHSIKRLQTTDNAEERKRTLATIVYTNNLETELSVGTSYSDCFKGFELRRTEIAMVCFGGQLVCGLVFAYASTYFFQQVGLDVDDSYSLGWGANALALVGCFVNWFVLMPRFGRRTVYVVGMAAMAIELYLIGILNIWTDRKPVAWTQAILTLVWTFTFQLSAGQLGWALPAEIGSTRLRQKTVCLARNASNVLGVAGGTFNSYMVNPTALNWKGYAAFVWGTCAALVFVWSYYRLPESKDRTFHELDILFAKGVPARKFATTNVDAFDIRTEDQLADRYAETAGSRRPSVVASVHKAIDAHGKA